MNLHTPGQMMHAPCCSPKCWRVTASLTESATSVDKLCVLFLKLKRTTRFFATKLAAQCYRRLLRPHRHRGAPCSIGSRSWRRHSARSQTSLHLRFHHRARQRHYLLYRLRCRHR